MITLCQSGCCHVTLIVLYNIATVYVVKMTHLLATVLPRCHIFKHDGHLLIECGYFMSKWLLPCNSNFLCNIVTVHVVKMTHLLATVLPRCHILRQNSHLLIECGYFKCEWLLPSVCLCVRVCVRVCTCV